MMAGPAGMDETRSANGERHHWRFCHAPCQHGPSFSWHLAMVIPRGGMACQSFL